MNEFDPPQWIYGNTNSQKKVTLEDLKEKRRKLVELQKIKALELKQKQYEQQMKEKLAKERAVKIQAVKQTAGTIGNVLKAGRKKLGDYESKRAKAQPRIGQMKKKSIYD